MKNYNFGLFSCFDDLSLCLYGCVFPVILNSSNLSKIRNEHWIFCHLLFPVCPFWVRTMVQETKKIQRSVTSDCFVTTFCTPCAIIQDAREIRGF